MDQTQQIAVTEKFTTTQQNILRAVCYSDIFNFPLKLNEIYENSHLTIRAEETGVHLNELVQAGVLKKQGEFYMLSSTDSSCVEKRQAAEQHHASLLNKVKKWSRVIVKFPFVKAICISGSYSKGAMGPDDDIDYFIITQKGRLWICRSLLRGYRKFFLRKSAGYMCLNYFIAEDNMRLPDRNIFVAHEVKSIIPVYGYEVFLQFMKENDWADALLPNKKPVAPIEINTSKPFLRKMMEFILSGFIGNWAESFLYKFMLRRRKRKFSHFNKEDFDLNMRTHKNAEKHHPGGTQKRVLSLFAERLQAFGIE